MERSTFRSIIVVSGMQKRQRYEECLASMPLFASLTPDQRAAIADCLSLETFQVCSLLFGLLSVMKYFSLHLCCYILGGASSAHRAGNHCIGTGQGVRNCRGIGVVPFPVAQPQYCAMHGVHL